MVMRDRENKKIWARSHYKTRRSLGQCVACGIIIVGDRKGKVFCQLCISKIDSNFTKKHRIKKTDSQRKRRKDLRIYIINHYGGQCSCCGEKEDKFLAIDHITPCGKSNRTSSYRLYLKIKRENYPNLYRILCHNCNFGRYLNGGACPHDKYKIHAA